MRKQRRRSASQQLRSWSVTFFATSLVQCFYFLNPKLPASSHLLCLYRLACVKLGRKPKLLVVSWEGSILSFISFMYLILLEHMIWFVCYQHSLSEIPKRFVLRLTPYSTIFQSCWEGAIMPWVLTSIFRRK